MRGFLVKGIVNDDNGQLIFRIHGTSQKAFMAIPDLPGTSIPT
jgi:hypothetical protein